MRRFSSAFLTLLIGFWLILGVSDLSMAEAQGSTSSNDFQKPFTKINVDLDQRIIGGNNLPFDVPFLFQGTISKQVHEVHATYTTFRRQSDLKLFAEYADFKNLSDSEQFDEFMREFKKHPDFERFDEFKGQPPDNHFTVFSRKSVPDRFKLVTNKTVDEKKWQEREIRPPWRQFEGASTFAVTPSSPAETATTFTLLVPALEPNRYFHFKFSFRHNLSENETKNFSEKAREIVDEYFRRRGKIEGSVTFDKNNALRLELIKAILGRTELTPTPEPGSIFDGTADPEAVEEKFTEHLVKIRNAHNDRYRGSFIAKRFVAGEYLYELITQLAKMRKNLETNEFFRPQVEALEFMQFSPADASADASALVASALADGSQPFRGEEDLDLIPVKDAWKVTDLDVRLDRLQRTIDALEELKQVVSNNEPLRRESNLSTDEFSTLADSIDESKQRIRLVYNELSEIRGALERRKGAIDEFIKEWGNQIRADITVFGHSVGAFDTRHKWYVSADVGIAWAPHLETTLGYFGFNIYLRPVNKEAPLRFPHFLRRFAFMIGINVTGEVKNLDEGRNNLSGNNVLLIGAGLRLLDSIRVSGGGVVFKKLNPNPLIDDESIAISPFVSISFDWNIKDTFKKLIGAFGVGS